MSESLSSPTSDALVLDVVTETTESSQYLSRLSEQKVDIPVLQDKTRVWLATSILIGLGVTLVGIFAYVFFSQEEAISKRELITLVWTSEVTLVSSVLGFYFGSKSN